VATSRDVLATGWRNYHKTTDIAKQTTTHKHPCMESAAVFSLLEKFSRASSSGNSQWVPAAVKSNVTDGDYSKTDRMVMGQANLRATLHCGHGVT